MVTCLQNRTDIFLFYFFVGFIIVYISIVFYMRAFKSMISLKKKYNNSILRSTTTFFLFCLFDFSDRRVMFLLYHERYSYDTWILHYSSCSIVMSILSYVIWLIVTTTEKIDAKVLYSLEQVELSFYCLYTLL